MKQPIKLFNLTNKTSYKLLIKNKKIMGILEILIILLVLFWFFGGITIGGGLINALLVIALILIIVRLTK